MPWANKAAAIGWNLSVNASALFCARIWGANAAIGWNLSVDTSALFCARIWRDAAV